MPVVRGIRVLNAISTGNTTPGCLETLLSDPGRLADVTQVLSSPQYACALAQSNTAAHTLVRSNNAMSAMFGNPIGSCIFYQTINSRDDMLASGCYYNYMMSFSTPEATCAFTNFGNTPTMINCAFASCTPFLTTAVSANSEITKLLTCNACVSACFRGTTCSIKEATGTPGRAAFWLGDATAFSCLQASGLDVAFANNNFLDTLNRDIACVICTPILACCAFGLATPANTYTRSVCATNEIVGKGACALGETSCNFVCWYASCLGVTCMASFLESGNTYFMDCFNSVNNFRQRSCIFFLQCNKNCYCSCIEAAPTSASASLAHKIIKAEVIARGGQLAANNANLPLLYYPHCNGQRNCLFTIANGSQLSNTEVEYLGRFIKCNYNVITHADCRLTLISPGFWNQSSAIACFRSCYCCSLDRTTANTSGLTLNCSLYYTTDNAATFNRLCVPLPACIFQQLCGNECCQFTVRYGLSSFACCNYIYTGWIISDCATGYGSPACNPAWLKTGHSRVCIHAANSQPNYDTWTHFPDVPLPFYTIAFCDEYFAGVSPMRTDGYQTVLGIQNQASCTPTGQYAMMFSFGKIGDCVRVSCDHFVRYQPPGLVCFDVCGCCQACCSLPAITHCIFGTCFEDYFQGHGSNVVPDCYCYGPAACPEANGCRRIMGSPSAASHTLIYKNPNCQADSKAFLVGWRSFAMLYGGTVAASGKCVCAMIWPCGSFPYNCCTCRGVAEGLPYGCGYFANSPGVNVWCYGAQANNTMQGTELDCTNVVAIGGSSGSSWTNFTFANAKIIGCRLVLAGNMPPVMHLCSCCSNASGELGGCQIGFSRNHVESVYGCQNSTGQTGHTTVINTDGVVGTIVCCFDSMYHQTPFSTQMEGTICTSVMFCGYCSGRCFTCVSPTCFCLAGNSPPWGQAAVISDYAGLKTINMYGTSNSIYSIPAHPNMPPQFACCGTSHMSLGSANCYVSAAKVGETVMKSNKSAFNTIDAGDARQCQWGTTSGPFRPGSCSYSCVCNPGVANAVAIQYTSHVCSSPMGMTCCYYGIYTPPNCSQDMATFDSTFNFCYVISPHTDLCLDGPLCFLQQCECFGPNCCLAVPCSPCCPCCNVSICCCVCGFFNGSAQQFPHCCVVRPTYTRQHVKISSVYSYFPSTRTPPRFCCSACVGCPGYGNHHFATAAANNTFQCAFFTCFHMHCPGNTLCQGCCCSASNTQCVLESYDRLVRTCNQAGPNCLWFDFITSTVPDWRTGDAVCHLPCHTFFNKQYLMGLPLCTTATERCSCGLTYSVDDDSKKAGFRLYSSAQCCSFCVASPSMNYPILYATQTRGSGAPLNAQNSIHIAYFDLIPFRCCLSSGSGGFFANGNACPSASGLVCCLMFSKVDIFYNV